MKKQNTKRSNLRVTSINIDVLARDLKKALAKRAELQNWAEQLWGKIRKTHRNYDSSMSSLTRAIGDNTNKINKIIGKLCQYKKTHEAMRTARNYLQGEIARCKKIISSWERAVREVDSGQRALVRSTGEVHTDTRNAKEYIAKKQQQLNRMERWLKHIERYA